MLIRLVAVCMIRPSSPPPQIAFGLNAPRGQGDVLPCLQLITFLWSQNSMANATLKMKKATISASATNEKVLRTKTFQRAANLLKQVSDSTRLQVVSLLTDRERHVGGLCEDLTQNPAVMSHHLALLRHGGIVERRRQGKNYFYTLTDTGYRLSKIVKDVSH